MPRVRAVILFSFVITLLFASSAMVCAAGKTPPKKKGAPQPGSDPKMSITRTNRTDDADAGTVPADFQQVANVLRKALLAVTSISDDPATIFQDDPQSLGEEGDVIASITLNANRDCAFVAVRFKDEETLGKLMQGRPFWMQLGAVALVPEDLLDPVWEDAVIALSQAGAKRVITPEAAEQATMSRWLELDTQINIFLMVVGHPPDFTNQKWRELLRGRFITRMPVNQASPIDVQSVVTVVSIEGADGSRVSPTEAGWVWNNADHRIFAAGMQASQFQAAKTSKEAGEDAEMQAALLRVRVVVAKFYNDWSTLIEMLARKRQLHFPTLEEAQTIVRTMGKAGYNPFNGNNEVQSARWKRGNPPVSGHAGWNYDSVSGKFWCNSRNASAHKL